MSSRLYMQLRGVGSYLGETPQRRGDSVAVRRHCPGLNKPHALRNVKERARHHRRPIETDATGPVRGRRWTPDRPELHVVPAIVSYARGHASQDAVIVADPVANHHIRRTEELAQTLQILIGGGIDLARAVRACRGHGGRQGGLEGQPDNGRRRCGRRAVLVHADQERGQQRRRHEARRRQLDQSGAPRTVPAETRGTAQRNNVFWFGAALRRWHLDFRKPVIARNYRRHDEIRMPGPLFQQAFDRFSPQIPTLGVKSGKFVSAIHAKGGRGGEYESGRRPSAPGIPANRSSWVFSRMAGKGEESL